MPHHATYPLLAFGIQAITLGMRSQAVSTSNQSEGCECSFGPSTTSGSVEQREELVADPDGLFAVRGVGEDEVGDAQVAVAVQGLGHVVGGADQPRSAGASAAVLAGGGE